MTKRATEHLDVLGLHFNSAASAAAAAAAAAAAVGTGQQANALTLRLCSFEGSAAGATRFVKLLRHRCALLKHR